MRGYPQFSFWILITLVKIYSSCTIINRGKNLFLLVGTVLKAPANWGNIVAENIIAEANVFPFGAPGNICFGSKNVSEFV